MKRCQFFILFLSYCMAMPAFAAKPLEAIENVTLIKFDKNDGDSFMVRTPKGEELHLRLYHVDCPEISVSINVEQIFEQQNHFGLEDPRDVRRFGKQAAKYVKQVLSRPFTIYTAKAKAPAGRFYTFVETHDGHDLGHLLVEQGLARVHGKPRSAPDGTPSKFVKEELRDMISVAMLKRAGIWGTTNPDLLYGMRERQREIDRKRKELRDKIEGTDCDDPIPFDLNTASQECLEKLDDIGKGLAKKIIDNRPYQSVDDLSKVPYIGKERLKKNRSRVTVGTAQSNSTEQLE